MKWAYIPFIFILSFAYSKYAFQLPKFQKDQTYRSPANSYEQENSQVKREEIKGDIIGDVDWSNFAFVLDDQLAPQLTIADISKAKKGSFYQEMKSHLSFSQTLALDFDEIKYKEKYLQGLESQEALYSRATYELMDKFKNDLMGDLKKLALEGKNASIVFKDDENFEKSKNDKEIKEMITKLSSLYPQINILDVRRSLKEKQMFQVLLRTSALDPIKWYEFRPAEALFNKLSHGYIQEQVFEYIDEVFYNKKLSQHFFMLDVGDKSYLVTRRSEMKKLSLDGNLKNSIVLGLLYDQAMIIGQIHGRSLQNEKDLYLKLIKN
jgi:hypothetical protein